MRDKTREPDAFENLDAEQEPELAELVEVLKQEQFVADDERFWARLHQSIVNQVAVTPMPRRASDAPRGLGRRMASWIAHQVAAPHWSRVALAGAALIAIILLGVWLMSLATQKIPTPPVGPEVYAEQATERPEATVGAPVPPSLVIGPEVHQEQATEEPAVTMVAALDIPDELWSQGFLVHKGQLSTRRMMEELEERGDGMQAQFVDRALLADEADLAAFDWGDPYEPAGVWTLRHLTGEELQQFEQLLDG